MSINWIKIEERCEMPEVGEQVIAVHAGRWTRAVYMGNEYWSGGSVLHPSRLDPTHWARVELPE